MFNNSFISVNSVRFVNYESYQRRSLAPVRLATTNKTCVGDFMTGTIISVIFIFSLSIITCKDISVNTITEISLVGVWQLKQRSGGLAGETIYYSDNPKYLLRISKENMFIETKNDSITFSDNFIAYTDSTSKIRSIVFVKSNRLGMMVEKVTSDSLILWDRMMDGFTYFYIRIN